MILGSDEEGGHKAPYTQLTPGEWYEWMWILHIMDMSRNTIRCEWGLRVCLLVNKLNLFCRSRLRTQKTKVIAP